MRIGGWYIFSGWLCDGHANAPPFDWAPGNGAGSFIDQINQLASAGFKQFVVYDINKIICGGAVNKTLVPVLDSFAAVGARGSSTACKRRFSLGCVAHTNVAFEKFCWTCGTRLKR